MGGRGWPAVPPRLPRQVDIHYLRPPDRRSLYRQLLVHDDGRVKVTFAADLRIEPPLMLGGVPALETGSDAVWFTFPGAWHDIGRFHRAGGALTGIYANVITPCLFEPGGVWRTTDLYLDLWIPVREERLRPEDAQLLDRDELEQARASGNLDPALAERAAAEGEGLLEAARARRWPPPVVHQWTRERCRRILKAGASQG